MLGRAQLVAHYKVTLLKLKASAHCPCAWLTVGQISGHWHSSLCAVGVAGLTFRLCLLTVGRDDDALELPELQVFQDLPQPQHEPAFCLGLDGILLVHPVLEAHQFLEQTRDTSIYFFTKHLAAVAERNPRDRECRQHQTEAIETPALTSHAPPSTTMPWEALNALYRPYPAFSSMCHPAPNTGTWTGCPEEPCELGGMSTANCSEPGNYTEARYGRPHLQLQHSEA